MGSRKNPNRRNAKTKYLREAFQGYTKAVCAQQRVDYLATGEFVSMPQILAAMAADRRPGTSLYDKYYAERFYKAIRNSPGASAGSGYYAVNENRQYREAQGRDREKVEARTLKDRLHDYAGLLKQRVGGFFSIDGDSKPMDWVKARIPATESIYIYIGIGSGYLSVRVHSYSDVTNIDFSLLPRDVYQMAVKNNPHYCRHDSAEDGYQVLAVRGALARGRYAAAGIQMVRGFPHLCTGYIYQYKKEWRFQPQNYNALLNRDFVRLSREDLGGAA